MIETRVRVLSSGNGISLVEATEQNGCAACASRSSCGISGLGKYFDGRRQPVAIAGDAARPGEELLVGIAETDLLKVGLYAYVLPAMLAVSGAALADRLGLGDAGAVLAALAGVAAGLLFARFRAPTPVMHTRSIPITSPQGEHS
jgi:sigma-E factor negative regulatory protein RseC